MTAITYNPTNLLAEVVTVKEAAALTGVSQQAIKQAIGRGVIESRKSGATHLLRRSDVIAKWGSKGESKP